MNAHSRFDVIIRFDTSMLEKLSVDAFSTGLYGRFNTEKEGATTDRDPMASAQHLLDTRLHKSDTTIHYELQALPSIYFGRRVIGERALHGDRYSILMLICIASLITFLAVTNYINLTTLTLPNRSGEIAIKKVAGASRFNVLAGFALESFFVVMAAMLLAAVILFSGHRLINAMLPVPILQFIKAHMIVLIGLVPLMMIVTIVGP